MRYNKAIIGGFSSIFSYVVVGSFPPQKIVGEKIPDYDE